MVTVKRVDVTSAMRVGALVYAIVFTLFALIWAVFQSVILNGLASMANNGAFSVNGVPQGFSASSIATAGLAGCACGYLVGVISAAIGGGIAGLLVAISYNLVANWFGGLRVQLDSDDPYEKMKRELPTP